ncbi:MAG: asparaginase [Alphaproteobacteria bacterium]|nr:asparaginase [Alphaproteobacteria bacterium]MBV9061642.1 asparaginase [Alphaproteobacteria bacterium]
MKNPILVEVTRGPLVESVHRGAVAVAGADGSLLFAVGDLETPVYPRSSLKPIQALPLVESGAADAFGLTDAEIALACASHSGEPMHTGRVAAWLKKIGCSESDLACGPHAVRYEPVWTDMVRQGQRPTRIHNNCSGKHTGFLTVARHWGIATAGYEHPSHPLQQAVVKALAELANIPVEIPWGVDGCTAPNFALPISAFARALASLADPSQLPRGRAQAARRILRAMTAHPELVAGTGRSDTILMRAGRGRFATKAGAEAYYAAIIPEMGIGIALKIDDGAGRAAETAIAALLENLGLLGEDPDAHKLVRAPVLNTRNDVVGERRPARALNDSGIKTLKAH